jgi:hypothetical protein
VADHEGIHGADEDAQRLFDKDRPRDREQRGLGVFGFKGKTARSISEKRSFAHAACHAICLNLSPNAGEVLD